MKGQIVTSMVTDREDNFWIGGSNGVIERSPDGRIRRFTTRDGLPDAFVRSLWVDRDGNIWAGTNGGLARLAGDRFVTLNDDDSTTADRCAACSKTAKATSGWARTAA